MPHDNFMARDILSTLLALTLWPLILIVPGYVLGRLTNLLAFRHRVLLGQLAIALVLSVAICPIVTYLVARAGGFWLVWPLYVACWISGARYLFADWARIRRTGQIAYAWCTYRWPILIAAGWAMAVIGLLIQVQFGQQLYDPTLCADYQKHLAVTDAITRAGIPPENPFFRPALQSLPLHYYYFWHMLCSLVDRLGGGLVDVRGAVYAGTAYASLSLMAIIALFLRLLPIPGMPEGPKRIAIGLGLLLVSGLDILPGAYKLYEGFSHGKGLGLDTLEWWNEQISAWTTAMSWVPQHITGLVACLTALLVAMHLPAARTKRDYGGWAAIAGAACASSLGLSIWVTLVFAIFALTWLARLVILRQYRDAGFWALCGGVACALALPFVLDLAHSNQGAGSPIAMEVRRFFPVANYFLDHQIRLTRPMAYLLYLVTLPVNYGMEFGFFGVAGLAYWQLRHRVPIPRASAETMYLVLGAVSLVACTFLRSRIANNDLGWRGMMFAQFSLLVLAVAVVTWVGAAGKHAIRPNPVLRTLLMLTWVLGIMTVIGEYTLGRAYPILADHIATAPTFTPGVRGRQNLMERQAYQWIDAHYPPRTVVQHNPNFPNGPHTVGFYVPHRVIFADMNNVSLFGTDLDLIRRYATVFKLIYAEASTEHLRPANAAETYEFCRGVGIQLMVVKAVDSVYHQPTAWTAYFPVVYENPMVRVYDMTRLKDGIAPAPPTP